MGVVYRARQLGLNREVALKIILGTTFVTPDERERFRLEAEAAASLQDPNIVPVYEIGEDDGHDFYSMAYISGGTLSDHFEELMSDHRRAVSIMATLARTMQIAHDRGILHRDLKPNNILINQHGEPMISDFGLAYHLGTQRTLTLTGQILGTPQYMSPEQADGQTRNITTQTDVYSLGAILYELLAGKPVFKADSILGTLKLIQEAIPVPLRTHQPKVDRDLETIVSKCLEKKPSERYRSAKRLAEDLEAWLEHRPIAARPPGPAERTSKWIRRRPIHAALLASLTLLLLSLGIGGPLAALQQSQLRKAAEAQRQNARLSEQRALDAAALANRRARANQRLAYASSMQLVELSDELKKRNRMAPQSMLLSLRSGQQESDLRAWEWYYALAKEHLADITLGHRGEVHSMSFSPFGESFIASTPKGTTSYDTLSAPISRHFENNKAHLSSSWSPDGRLIATLDESGDAVVWLENSAKKLGRLPSDANILSISFGPDGKRLMTLDGKNRIRLWDVEDTPSLISSHENLPPNLSEISWSPLGTYVAAIGDSNEIFVWECARLDQNPVVYQGHYTRVNALSWRRDESWLASGSEGNIVRVWGVPGGNRILNTTRAKESFPISDLVWSHNGSRLIYCAKGSDKIYELDLTLGTDEELHRIPNGELTALAWSPEIFSIVAGYNEKNGKTGRILIRRDGLAPYARSLKDSGPPLKSIRWNTDGIALSALDEDGHITRFAPQSGEQKRTRKVKLKPNDQVLWSPGGPEIAVATKDRIRIFDPRPGPKKKAPKLTLRKPGIVIWFQGKEGFYSCSEDGEIEALTDSRKDAPKYDHPARGRYTLLSSSPSGKYLLATGHHGALCLWNRKDGTIVFERYDAEYPPPPLCHTWKPDDSHFAIGESHFAICIWSVAQREKLKTINAHRGPVRTIAWHPDGRRIVSGGNTGDIRIWDWQSAQLVWTLKGHSEAITDLSWAPQGRQLASASVDGSLWLWDATAGFLLDQGHSSQKE